MPKPDPMWDDWVSAGKTPSNALAFFGANCIHTPKMEDRSPHSCPRCGGAYVAPNGRVVPHRGEADEVRVFDHHVTEWGEGMLMPLDLSCGVCNRSRTYGTLGLDRHVEKLKAEADRKDKGGKTAVAVGKGTNGLKGGLGG